MAEKKMNKAQRLEAARAECARSDDLTGGEAVPILVVGKLEEKFDLHYSEAKQIVHEHYYCR